jgi:hypothetical protein
MYAERAGVQLYDRSITRPELIVRAPCAPCNNGWMSQLESEAKPIIEALLDGYLKSVDYPSQLILAAWAVKTAMVLEGFDPNRPLFYLGEERAQMRAGRTLPQRTGVWIAKCVNQRDFYSARTDHTTEPGPDSCQALAVTMAFGALAFQVFTLRAPAATPPEINVPCKSRSVPWDDTLVQMWPASQEPKPWPAKYGLDSDVGLNGSSGETPMNKSPRDFLTTVFGFWREIAEQTAAKLGEQTAGLFVELYNDAIDIQGAILGANPQADLLNSLVFTEFTGLFKELHWLHVLLVSGNYPIVLTRLRFNWERLFRARHADAYVAEHPNEADAPGPTIAEKHDWLTEREERLNWGTTIAPTLARLIPGADETCIGSHYRPLWQRLNRCVHPSGELREKLVSESALLVHDAFDEEWAREALTYAAQVFALIWMAVLSRFPAAIPRVLSKQNAFQTCPQVREWLKRLTMAV